jgi:UDP-N-acetylglucosamine/UDP-N-acetylgalactosamine diphosphorylase
MSVKTIPKYDPNERIGVFLLVNGIPEMMDYGDIPKELNELIDDKGKLLYRSGNMLNYLISTNILEYILCNDNKYKEIMTEFHFAKKKVKCLNDKLIEDTYDIIKFELFLNSIFHYVDENGLLLYEINREDEFAPVKNSNDQPNDSQITSMNKMYNVFNRWYINNGGKINGENIKVEISYRLSYDGEGLETMVGRVIEEDTYLNK